MCFIFSEVIFMRHELLKYVKLVKKKQEIQNIKSVFFTTIEKVLLHKYLSAEITWTIQLFQAIFCSHKPINYN